MRAESYSRLGIVDFDTRQLIAECDDESADYEALLEYTEDITHALDDATYSDLRMFINGQGYAHSDDLYGTRL